MNVNVKKSFLAIPVVLFAYYGCGGDANSTNAAAGGQIIADHTIVADYSKIPQTYIDKVKTMWIDIMGESHSMAYRKGLILLQTADSRFACSVVESGDPETPSTSYLRSSRAMRDGTSWTYSTGEEEWFTNDTGIAIIKNHLQYCSDQNLGLSVLGFGWCYDMIEDGKSAELDPVYNVHWFGRTVDGPEGNLPFGLDANDTSLTKNNVCMQTYLDVTSAYQQYCIDKNIATVVIFTTGPVDVYYSESGYQRELKHQFIRDYVLANASRILFDYADILCYNDAGEYSTKVWTDSTDADHTFPVIHPDNLQTLDGVTDSSLYIGHIGEKGALRIAKAEWWLLARIAGWDGK